MIGARVCVRGEVLDEREVADEVEDDVDDLHVALLPLLLARPPLLILLDLFHSQVLGDAI